MANNGISGTAVVMLFGGSVIAYSAIKGISISTTLRDLLTGKSPVTEVSASVSPDAGVSDLSNGSNVKQIGQLLASPYGWSTGAQWTALDELWTRESNWNPTAKNPSSGAYGIAQALPASKYPAAGQAPTSSAQAQIQWGLTYIKDRYGNPVNAWAHEQQYGWY